MKMTRKFFPALVMLIVSAIMLSTASYAWLASSSTVKADGMTVQANTDVMYLQITNNKDSGTWGTSASAPDATKEALDLHLVNAYVEDGAVKWRESTSVDPDSPDANGYTPVDEADLDGTYALINTFYVSMSEMSNVDLEKLYISDVSVTGGEAITAEDFDASLRVLVIAKDDEDTILGYQCQDVLTNDKLVGFAGTDSLTGNEAIDSETIITLEVYIYFDGEDEQAFTNNLDSYARTIEVSFSATPVSE